MVRQGDLGQRANTRQRIPVEGIDPASVRVGDSLRLRPTRDAGRLLEAEARPRAIRTRPTPGDSVRELAVDNRSVPSPGLRRGDPTTRNGAPIAYDRILASRFGVKAAELIAHEQFGQMVALRSDEIISVPIRDAVSRPKYVDPNGQMVQTARNLGISFGDGF